MITAAFVFLVVLASSSACACMMSGNASCAVMGESGEAFVAVDLRADDNDDEKRGAVQVVLLLDRSGSMMGTKWTKLVRSMQHLNVSAEDFVDVVVFNDLQYHVASGFGTKAFMQKLRELLSTLTPNSATDIGGALKHVVDAERPLVYVLMSDGEPTHGLQGSALVERAQELGKPVSTIAFGKDADKKLLQLMAHKTGGSFFDGENESHIAKAFAFALAGVQSTIVRGIQVQDKRYETLLAGENVRWVFTAPECPKVVSVTCDGGALQLDVNEGVREDIQQWWAKQQTLKAAEEFAMHGDIGVLEHAFVQFSGFLSDEMREEMAEITKKKDVGRSVQICSARSSSRAQKRAVQTTAAV